MDVISMQAHQRDSSTLETIDNQGTQNSLDSINDQNNVAGMKPLQAKSSIAAQQELYSMIKYLRSAGQNTAAASWKGQQTQTKATLTDFYSLKQTAGSDLTNAALWIINL